MNTPTLIELLEPAQHILAFTGAGISTGSGIPDFRGPQGIWKTRQPVYYDEFMASEAARVEYWDYKAEGFEAFRDAQPNAGHRALVTLEEMGRLEALVTQNIDGLHQAAGTSEEKLVEVHGTNRYVECTTCGKNDEPGPAVAFFREHEKTPLCECGGWLKFATISFGQALKPEVIELAIHHAEQADLVLALGSTLSVHPAASIPQIAAQHGAPYVIINQGPTDHDSIATLRLEGDVASLLPPAIEALQH